MADLGTTETSEVTVADSAGVNRLKVNIDGSVNVIPLVNPPAPANTTPVTITAFGTVSTTTGEDTFYTITNNKILTIQTLITGAQTTTGGSVTEIFYDPNANLTGMTRVSTVYIDGESAVSPVTQSFTGNGTRRIVLRRRGFTNSAREMFAQWLGYEE